MCSPRYTNVWQSNKRDIRIGACLLDVEIRKLCKLEVGLDMSIDKCARLGLVPGEVLAASVQSKMFGKDEEDD